MAFGLSDLARVFLQAEDQTAPAFDSFKRNVQSAEGAIDRLRGIYAGLVSTISGGIVFQQMAKALMEAEQASNRLEAVLTATGHAAGLSKRQLDEMADAI